MQISKVQPTDLQAPIDLENSTFLSDRISRKQFVYSVNKQKYFFVAKIQDLSVVYILCFEYKRTIRVYSLAVGKNYQGQGIGKKLLQYILDNSSKNISLEVNVNNFKAICLYRKLGFKINKQIDNFYENNDTAYKMLLIRK